jgi:hypothetical protein
VDSPAVGRLPNILGRPGTDSAAAQVGLLALQRGAPLRLLHMRGRKLRRLWRVWMDPMTAKTVPAPKPDYRGMDLAALAEVFADTVREKRELDVRIAETNLVQVEIEQLLLAHFDAECRSKFSLADGGVLFLVPQVYCAVRDRRAFFGWVKANSKTELLSVNLRTLGRAVRDLLREGEPAPPGVEITLVERIGNRKIKEKKNDDCK